MKFQTHCSGTEKILLCTPNFVRKKNNFCPKEIPVLSEQNITFLRTKFWPDLNMFGGDYRERASDIRTCRATRLEGRNYPSDVVIGVALI